MRFGTLRHNKVAYVVSVTAVCIVLCCLKVTMLFKRNGKSMKFCLARLEAAERNKIENLITENGGKVCTPSKIGTNRVYGDSFFHIDYIYECLKQGQLLDLHPFSILGLRSLVYEKRGSFRTTDKNKSRIPIEHNYAMRVSKNEKQCSNDSFHSVPLIVLVPSLEDLPRSSIRSFRNMCSSMPEKNVIKEIDSPTKKMTATPKKKHKKENKNPGPDYPLLILHRWVNDSESKAVTEKNNVQCCNKQSLSQPDNEKLAVATKIAGSEKRLSKRSRTATKKPSVRSINELRELPSNERLQEHSGCEQMEDVPLIERLQGLQTSKTQECDDSNVSINASPTIRKKRNWSSLSDDSADSDTTVLTRGLNRMKRLKEEQQSLEDSNDSDKTVLWGDFSRKKKAKGNHKRKSSTPYIDDDSTATKTVSTRETRFRRSKEPVETIAKIESLPPREVSVSEVVLSALSSDETEYEADTELEDDNPSRVETKEREKDRETNNEDENDSKIEIKELEKLGNSRESSPGCSFSATEDDGSSVIFISDDNKPDAVVIEITSDSDNVAQSCGILSDSDSSAADPTARVPARIAAPVEPPTRMKKTVRRIEKPVINGPNGVTDQKLSRNFQRWEQNLMLQYLMDCDAIGGAKGYDIWKQMIKDNLLTHRTHYSLQNHFRRSILPIIHRFNIDEQHLVQFEKLKQY